MTASRAKKDSAGSVDIRSLVIVLVLALTMVACGHGKPGPSAAKASTVHVVVAYQSKTIDTVTAGTLLRDLGILERRLNELGKRNGNNYSVTWQDYPSGPPITAQMLADNVDFGSMGDYPLLVNGSKTKGLADARSELIAVAGYNLQGSLNSVVVPVSSKARTLNDLKGQSVSTSIGSAAHGMLVNALSRAGKTPDVVNLVNQQPEVGLSALQGGQVAALAQFVPWPEVVIFRGIAKKLYDGGSNGVPTLHGVLVRQSYAHSHPEVVDAFLAGMIEATAYLRAQPLAAAQRVSKASGIEAEVVYLFNGPGGLVTFDPTLKAKLIDALRSDLPFLKSLSAETNLDLSHFVNDSYLRQAYGPTYDQDLAKYDNPLVVRGRDDVCGGEVTDQRTASEAWFEGEDAVRPARNPTCMLTAVRRAEGAGKKLRAGYVPDAGTGTRTFAAAATWVDDPSLAADGRLLPFATLDSANAYTAAHPGSKTEDYRSALAAAPA